VTTVAGHPDSKNTFYMGATGGGVWKTTNYGQTWQNVSDGYFATGSIGAIAVAPSDQKILYVGTGSDGIRSNVIIGKGVYKSNDAGKTWQHLGLENTGQIGAVIINPINPDIALVAAIGNPFLPNKERGVYRTQDGGKNWTKSLFISDTVGIADLEFAPDNAQTVYATAWRVERKPWTIISGGKEGGIYKSEDAGVSWKKLSAGLPRSLIGKIDLAVSAENPARLWALIEAPEGEGGVYKSDDRGESFTLVSTKKDLLDRPFYYCNIDANPQNANTIYVNSTSFWQSTNGGVKWQKCSTPHGDNHDMWINPNDSNLVIQCNDGGANITLNGGSTWSSLDNQPTAELYQVAVDDQQPYWLYAGQQDNTTIAVPSLPVYASLTNPSAYWREVGGCETGPAVPKPGSPHIVYSNCKGRFGVYNSHTGQEQQYYIGATNIYGHNPRDLKFRFQRVSPIHVSPHDRNVVYHASQYLHKTTDEGKTWSIISPDLTAFTPETQVISGTPITRDVTGEEYFSTIYTVKESNLEPGLIWVGANDGPVHVTRDGGKNWINVTPKALPPLGRIQTIEPSPHQPGKAYFAAYRYLLGDFKPYIFKTEDYGESWTLLTDGDNGIPGNYPTRVIREDPDREGLLFAGTEFGLFVSLNDGRNWQAFQQNLPVTPITDIQLHQQDLILSTMGRSFWILDDISLLHQIDDTPLSTTLFAPKQAYRMRYRGTKATEIPNYPPPGIDIHYYLSKDVADIEINIYDKEHKLVRTFEIDTSTKTTEEETDMATGSRSVPNSKGLSLVPGTHTLRWDLRHNPIGVKGKRTIAGPLVAPGKYEIELKIGLHSYSNVMEILISPNIAFAGVSQDDLIAQEALALEILMLIKNAHSLDDFITKNIRENETSLALEELKLIKAELVTAEGRYQVPMLHDQLRYLASMLDRADQRPGQDAYARFDELKNKLEDLKNRVGTPGVQK
jgi:photosystem II stability/assembly factor-like uncharacterized protein